MIEMRAKAQADAIRIIAESLEGSNASDAAKLAVAREVLLWYMCCRFLSAPIPHLLLRHSVTLNR